MTPDPILLWSVFQRPVSLWCHMWRQFVGRARRWTKWRNSCFSPIQCLRVSFQCLLFIDLPVKGKLSGRSFTFFKAVLKADDLRPTSYVFSHYPTTTKKSQKFPGPCWQSDSCLCGAMNRKCPWAVRWSWNAQCFLAAGLGAEWSPTSVRV